MRFGLTTLISLLCYNAAFAYTFDATKLGKTDAERLNARISQSKQLVAIMNDQDDAHESSRGRLITYLTLDSRMDADLNSKITVTRQVSRAGSDLSAGTSSAAYFCDYQLDIPKSSKVDIVLVGCHPGMKPAPVGR